MQYNWEGMLCKYLRYGESNFKYNELKESKVKHSHAPVFTDSVKEINGS
jgi:hypothetical protein